MKHLLRLAVAVLSLIAMIVRSATADTLVLNGGRVINGTVLQTNEAKVLMLTDYGVLSYAPSIIKEVKTDKPTAKQLQSPNRIPDSKSLIRSLSQQAWANDLQQIPATVIDKGILKNVPYVSFRCANDYEVNIYGDPENPAAIEVGIYRALLNSPMAKSNCVKFMTAMLGSGADKEIVRHLKWEKDLQIRDGLTFEITPPTAEDAYLGWWISAYSEQQLGLARATDDEIGKISVAKADIGKASSGVEDPSAWTDKELRLARSNQSETITFKSKYGDVIEDAEVVRVNDGVSLVWRKGASGGIVKLADLPQNLRTRYGYDSAKTELAEAAEKEKRARDLAQAQAQAQTAQIALSAAAPSDDQIPYASSGSYSGASSSGGRVYVRGYTRKDGTYVHSYTRSSPRRR